MSFGSFLQGAAEAGSSDIKARQATADQLKMHSALLSQQDQFATSQKMLSDQLEQQKYARENTITDPAALGALQALADKVAPESKIKVKPGISTSAYQAASGALQHMNTIKMLTQPAGNSDEIDQGTGIPVSKNVLNGMGTVMKTLPYPGAKEKIAQHGELTQFVQNLDHSMSLHDALSAPGGGLLGSALNGIATNAPGGQSLMPARAELSKLADATSILQGKMLDRVPGGKSSLGLGKKSEGYQIRAETSKDIVGDIYDNSAYQAYRQFTAMGPSTIIPQNIKEKFDWLPKTGGQPVNVIWRGGKAYLPGHKEPLDNPNDNQQPASNQPAQQPPAAANQPDNSGAYDHMTTMELMKLAATHMDAVAAAHDANVKEKQKQAKKAN